MIVPLNIPTVRASLFLKFRADNEQRQQSDCTHFCSPSGALMFWRELLYNALLVLENESRR